MLKTTYEADFVAIPKEELVDAAKRFLLQSHSDEDFIPVENVDSLKFGSSDLLFVNKGKTNLTVVRLCYRESSEKFFISSVSYCLWLVECITAGKILFNGKTGLNIYLFSHEFSTEICYLVDNLSHELPIHLVKYYVIHAEDLDEPAIHFQHLNLKGPVHHESQKDRLEGQALRAEKKARATPLEISVQELNEFQRLKQHYLD
ncbi:MAG: hypothetical protein JSV60_10800 [Desulfobacterales bacterium]|nr:MAG: hypothetical protein JSV60_10800 [Desulfobacterales bacterium]